MVLISTLLVMYSHYDYEMEVYEYIYCTFYKVQHTV